ncbi:hypothetical protein OKW22_000016 [Bacilli bacterium PM5-3]|nr:hypothetical protein [Bacilli bacterium PM5-3]
MKKLLALVLSLFLLVGCSQQDNKYKDEALEAYVQSMNKLEGKNKYSIGIDGKIDVPKSLINTEEVNSNFSAKGIVDLKNELAKFEMNLDDKQNDQSEKMEIYLDKKYVYIKSDNSWYKQELDESISDSVNSKTKDSEKLDVDKARETFETFKNVEYTKEIRDSQEGYLISATIDLDTIMSMIKDEKENIKDLEKQIEQFKALMQKMNIEYEVFIPMDNTKYAKHRVNISLEVLKSEVNVGPIDINLEPTNEKIKIPSAAKKAKVVKQDSVNSLY